MLCRRDIDMQETNFQIFKRERDQRLIEQIMKEVQQHYEQFGKVLREEFCREYKRSSSTIRRLFGSWNDMLRISNIPINMNKKITKEEVKKEMLELYQKHGKLTAEIQRNESSYSQIAIDNLFGSFGGMMEQIGLREEKQYQTYKDEELLNDLREIVQDYGYIDSKLMDQVAKASIQIYVARFGTCSQAVMKAGLKYGYTGHGFASKPANKVISIISEILDEQPHMEFAFEWLRSRTGNKIMPVDAYFEKANLVVEYHGEYHFHHIPFMHYRKSLEEVQLDDGRKEEAILEHRIRFLVVAYNESKSFDYLFRKLKNEIGIKVFA
jgi:hypothetical protein